MAIDTKHPLYTEFLEDWILVRDAYRGERRVKQKGTVYLPATSGQIEDGMGYGQNSIPEPGRAAYNAYLTRAAFPEFVSMAVEAMIGMMHRKPPVVELPPAMEPMLERATVDGESMGQLLRRINEQQLVAGRLGLMLDVPNGAGPEVLPYVATYIAESIINWDDGAREELVEQKLNLVVLDESEHVRLADFSWDLKEKFRVLVLGNPQTNEPDGLYRVAIVESRETSSLTDAALVEPQLAGRTLGEIPFVFINSKDIVPEPDDPPLIGLARKAMLVYRGEADYRQSLFMQGQDTLVVKGANTDKEEKIRVGANARIDLPADGDAKYIGTDAKGLPEMRTALENDRAEAMRMAAQVADQRTSDQQSGRALRVRIAAETATLTQIALTGAAALERLLRIGARWRGLDPDEVHVTPNLEFAAEDFEGRQLVDMMTARAMGAPISLRTVHDNMRRRDVTHFSYDEEVAEIEAEGPDLSGTGVAGGEADEGGEGEGS